MSSCHTFRPVPGQCGPRGRGPLPAPLFDPQDYWATRKLVSSLFGTLETSKLDKTDVVDPGTATEEGKAADAKRTQEELDRISGAASDAKALAESKADKLSSRQLEAVNSGIDSDKVAKIAQNETAISEEVSRATTEEARLQALINAIKTFDAVVADSLPTPSEQYIKKLYLVPSTNPETRNVKDEFICVKIVDSWSWEQVGSTAITIEFDDEPTEGSQKAARSGGIWSWVKSLLPRWLTSDYAEPATVESVAKKADKATPVTDGNLAALTADGNLADSGIAKGNVATKNNLEGYLPLTGGTITGDLAVSYNLSAGYNLSSTFFSTSYSTSWGDVVPALYYSRWYYLPNGSEYPKMSDNEIAVKGDISALSSSKADKAPNATSGHLASLTEHGDLGDSGLDSLDIARMYGNRLVVQPGGMTTTVDASMLGYSIDSSDTIKDRLDAKADKIIPSKWGNLSALAEDGNLIDSSVDMQDLALKNQVNWMADSDSGFASGQGDGFFFNIENGEQRLAVLKGRVIVDRDGKDAGERSVAMLGDINSATRGKADRTSLAPEYSATSAYSVGAIVYHDGSIYQCKAAIADGGEAWNAEKWELRKLDDFFTESNSLLTGTIDAEVISKGTAPDAHLEAPTDEHLKLILADGSVAYDSAKALPYKLTSAIGDRVVATMTLTAALTDIALPTISADDTTVKDFILDVTNAYAVEGVATDAGINIPRTDFKLVTRDGESLTDVTTVKAGKSAFICFTQKSPVVVDGTTYPCWCVIQLPFGDPS